MSLKDYLTENDNLTNEELNKILFKEEIYNYIHCNEVSKNEVLDKFLKLVIPYSENCYWLFLNRDSNIYCNLKFNYDNYLTSIKKLCYFETNLYFSPVSYKGFRTDKNALKTNCIYIDIDDIEEDISYFNKKDIINFLMITYKVPVFLLPNFVCKSGHGLHLYYITESCGNTEYRKEYVRSLTTFYKGDVACIPISHIIRVPLSYNIKKDKVKSELFELNTSTDFSFSRLDFFKKTEEENYNYYELRKSERNAKAQATREKNKGETTQPKHEKPQKEKNKQLTTSETVDVSCWKYRKDYKINSIYNNLLIDLHNYFMRHNGDITGYRNNFVFIFSNLCRVAGISEKECNDKINIYITNDFKNEAITIIENTYKRFKPYQFTNIKIAELLNFNKDDIKYSYCAFSEERKALATYQRNKRKSDKRKASTKNKKNKQIEFILSHQTMTTKEIATQLGISQRTVQRIQKNNNIIKHKI